jgi:hypothetical protein
MRLLISKEPDGRFLVEDRSLRGSPPVGRGRTILEAIGSWLHSNRALVGVAFDVDHTAKPAEERRRRRELAKR